MFLYEWIIYEFQVSIYIEFNKNLLNIKHTDIIAIFLPISKYFGIPEDWLK